MPDKVSDERLREIIIAADGVTSGPWAYRPEEYDDWGFVRGNRTDSLPGDLVAVLRKPNYLSEEVLAAHRKNGTDPCRTDGIHIANCDPQTIASMANELLIYRGRND